MSTQRQYITNDLGEKVAIILPIQDYTDMLKKIENAYEVPAWQQEIVKKRIEDHNANPNSSIDFDKAINDIEKDL